MIFVLTTCEVCAVCGMLRMMCCVWNVACDVLRVMCCV